MGNQPEKMMDYEEPPEIITKKDNNKEEEDVTEIFSITSYKKENLLYIISLCHLKAYKIVSGIFSFFKANPQHVNAHFDEYVQKSENTLQIEINYILEDTDYHYDDFNIFTTHFMRIRNHKQTFINGTPGLLENLIGDINLFVKEKEDIEALTNTFQIMENSNCIVNVEYVAALTLWLNYKDLASVIRLESFGLTIQNRQAQPGFITRIFNERVSIVQLIGIKSGLIHFNLYTQKHARNVLINKVLTSKLKKDSRHYLLRVCLDQPGHYEIFQINKNHDEITIRTFFIEENYVERNENLFISNLYNKHHTGNLQFFFRQRLQRAKIEFKTSYKCISCGDDANFVELNNINHVYCDQVCQLASRHKHSFYICTSY
jgi:hypothetical protein